MPASRLYFAQHGLAVSKSENPDRPLSETGIKQSQAIATHIRSSDIPVSQIFHSGKLRALQTAEIFASTLSVNALSASDHLSPDADVKRITQTLNTNNALYIGHLPHLDKLVSYLVTDNEEPCIIKFQNSAVICLEKNNDLYHVQWYLTPELITS
jgi:phosphohistidine phosphatase